MKIETKKNYVIRITHEERATIMNALAYTMDHDVGNDKCKKLFDEFINHNKEE